MAIARTRLYALLSFIITATVIAGCGAQEKPIQGAEQEPLPTVPAIVQHEMTVSVYGVSSDWLELVERKVQLTYETEQDLIQATLAELQRDEGQEHISLWSKIQILQEELSDGAVMLDIHIPDDAHTGSFGELQTLESLKETLFQFDFVREIELRIDGSKAESMMGHVEIDDPITRQS